MFGIEVIHIGVSHYISGQFLLQVKGYSIYSLKIAWWPGSHPSGIRFYVTQLGKPPRSVEGLAKGKMYLELMGEEGDNEQRDASFNWTRKAIGRGDL